MMLHRHFENEEDRRENMTTLAGMSGSGKEFVSEIFPPEEPVEAPKRRGRQKKTAEE